MYSFDTSYLYTHYFKKFEYQHSSYIQYIWCFQNVHQFMTYIDIFLFPKKLNTCNPKKVPLDITDHDYLYKYAMYQLVSRLLQ